MRNKIIAANWKMNKGAEETKAFFGEFVPAIAELNPTAEVVVSVPFVNLAVATEATKNSKVSIAAQNVSQFDKGAYTGEISVSMLKEIGVNYVVTGHSERRTIFGECDRVINAKNCAVLDAGLTAIFCIGETLEEREGGKLEAVLKTQVTEGLRGVCEKGLQQIVVAYEPVWAIGTGVTASTEQAQEAHAYVRSLLAELYTDELASGVRIQYGGSMKAANAGELMSQEDIDGGLVGGASLESSSFIEIVKSA